MLKPGGTLSLPIGSLSTAAAIGGGATGANLAAASLSGRPIRGEPGGSGAGAAAGAAAGGGLAGCCAAAPNVNTPIKAPASNKLRGADEPIIMTSSPVWKPYPRTVERRPCRRPSRVQSLIFFRREASRGSFRDGPEGPGLDDWGVTSMLGGGFAGYVEHR